MPLYRILVVEDHAAVRRFFCSMLQQRPDFVVVGEASDGIEAVDLARQLRPDLVLLDIGLPKLGGLDAARQIRTLVPGTKLLFLSLEALPSTVKEASSLGAEGYLHKLRVQSDLLPAIDAVLAGTQFLGTDVSFSQERDSYARHEVVLHSDDSLLLEGVTRFLSTAMKAGNPAIVLATKQHSEGLIERLKGEGLDIEAAIRRGTYVALDAEMMLSQIMRNDSPDLDAFLSGLDGLVESAALASGSESARVAIFGECVGILSAAGNIEAAIEIERTGNDLLKTRSVDILCAYPLSAFQAEDRARALPRICAEHTGRHSHKKLDLL